MKKKIEKIEDFLVYQKAMTLCDDFIKHDLPVLEKIVAGRELGRQQVRSLDSICSNTKEGYGRKASREFKCFFRISRGSAYESRGRYLRCKVLLNIKQLFRGFDNSMKSWLCCAVLSVN